MPEDFKTQLKKFIVDTLSLDGVDPAGIGDDDPLFGEGLGLDSIDGLELVIALEKKFGIKIRNSEESRKALQSVAVLAEFIERNRPNPEA